MLFFVPCGFLCFVSVDRSLVCNYGIFLAIIISISYLNLNENENYHTQKLLKWTRLIENAGKVDLA